MRVVWVVGSLIVWSALRILIRWLRCSVAVASLLLMVTARILLLIWVLIWRRLAMLKAAGSWRTILVWLWLTILLLLTVMLLLLLLAVLVVAILRRWRWCSIALLLLRWIVSLGLLVAMRIVRILSILRLAIARWRWRAAVWVGVVLVGHVEVDVVVWRRGLAEKLLKKYPA